MQKELASSVSLEKVSAVSSQQLEKTEIQAKKREEETKILYYLSTQGCRT